MITGNEHALMYKFSGAEKVAVIASFSTECEVKPLFARIGGESVKIYSSKVVDETFNCLVYECSVENYGTMKKIHLCYKLDEKKWLINYN